ncbi:hypothetical protein [Sporosarcina koreensis]|uniref:Uncharacterized protein n=1 Tax=Sporosarcina koreensis TaxID=334735 RepID=A0ABW0TZT3_9BACL
MRKFIISIVVTILLCPVGVALAVQRVVTSYIISDVWYENIFLIADKTDWMSTKNFTVQVGDDLFYNFPDWRNEKFTPKLFHEDINADELKDIIVVLISGAGSGISTKEIHVLNQLQDPYTRYNEVPVESVTEAVQRLVKMEQIGDKISILIGKKEYEVDYTKFNYHTPNNSPQIGAIEEYSPENGVLYGYTTVFVSIPEASIGTFKVKYVWDGERYKADSVAFIELEQSN